MPQLQPRYASHMAIIYKKGFKYLGENWCILHLRWEPWSLEVTQGEVVSLSVSSQDKDPAPVSD